MKKKKLYVALVIVICSALPLGKTCQEKPHVTIEEQFYHVSYGDKVTIHCSVVADPLQTLVYWNQNNSGVVRRLYAGLAGTHGMTVDNPSLMISFASMRDNGIYTCCAVNTIGTGYSEDIKLIVNGGLPLVRVNPINYNVLFGTFILIRCTVISNPKANKVYWQRTKDGNISTINTGSVGTDGITLADPSLTLKYTTSADAGIYVCFATNDIGTGLSKEVNITVYGDIPAVYIEHQKYKVDYGDSVVMKCIITATPDINEIYWEKHIHSIKTTLYAGHTGTDGNTISDPSLTINNVTLEDNAMYRCCAKNFVGTGLSTITELIVKGGIPKATVTSLFYNVVYGTRISLHCSVFSIPKITLIYWRKNVTGLVTTINSHTVGTDGITVDNPSLTILFPTHYDSGSYNCFASNVLGTSSSATTFLNVIGGVPIVKIEKAMQITSYGRNVTMKCNIHSTPYHTSVYWVKTTNGQSFLIHTGMPGIQGVVPDNPSLTIEYAVLSDSGMYTCFAKNIVGIGKSSISLNLTVIGHVPKVYTKHLKLTANVGIPVEMICYIEAIPDHTNVFWKRNINGIVTFLIAGMLGCGGMALDNPSLTVLNPTESMSGEYTCFSSNVIGTSSSSAIALIVRPLEIPAKYNKTDGLENHEISYVSIVVVVGVVFGILVSIAICIWVLAMFQFRVNICGINIAGCCGCCLIPSCPQ